jgi:SAM-dependent methyltransferase
MNCISCKTKFINTIFTASNQGLTRYGLLKNESEVHKGNTLDLEILRCDNCGLIWNSKFDFSKINYQSDSIQESRVFSESYRKFMVKSSDHIKRQLNLKRKTVVEIGCGDGYFLDKFSSNSNCIGFEPSDESIESKNKGLNIINDYYDYNHSYSIKADLIILRQVLEHLPNPLNFIRSFSENLLRESCEAFLYIEVPNSSKTLSLHRFPDFYYEHHTYFTIKSLAFMMEKCGFDVIEIKEDFNGEVISALMRSKFTSRDNKSLESSRKNAKDNITKMLDLNKEIVGWGAAGNGASFLNLCNIGSSKIKYIIDSDIRKHGSFIPGTGQRVISPNALEKSPDIFIVMTQFHKNDIVSNIREIYPDCKNIFTVEDLVSKDLVFK